MRVPVKHGFHYLYITGRFKAILMLSFRLFYGLDSNGFVV